MFVLDDKSECENEETEEDNLAENLGAESVQNTYTPNSKTVNDDDGPDDLVCKWGPVSANCCNSFRTPQMVLFILCCACCIQSMIVNGFINVIISSLEKRFDLRSTDSGLIASSYDLSVILCLIPVTYFGGIGSKPRWLGFGMIIVGVGAFVFTLPHFTTGLYKYSEHLQSDILCDHGNSTTSNDVQVNITTDLNNYKYVLIMGMMLLGIGAAPLYSLGVTYLDENVEQKWSSVYLGVFYTMAIVGPALGFALGGYFLSFYTDFDTIDTTELSLRPESVSWVGAWWLGFLIAGSLSVIIGLIILGFPQALPDSVSLHASRVSEAYAGQEEVSGHTAADLGNLKNFHTSLKVLLMNPTYALLNFAGSSEALVIAGTSIFIPKYVEYQFSISATFAALLIGLGTVIGGAAGTFFGGYMVKRLDLRVSGIIQMCMVTSCLAAVGQLGILFRCPDVTFAGVSHHYNGTTRSPVSSSDDVSLHAGCNTDCACANSYFNPVCAHNTVMYFTACAAGCRDDFTLDEQTKVYKNCTCVSSLVGLLESPADGAFTTREGRCSSNCDLMIVFVVIFSLVLFFTFGTVIPGLSATLRCVPEQQRSFSVGIQWIIVRLLGTIPGPILYGIIIDRSCLFWHQPQEDTDDGACYFYDSKHLSQYLLGITLGSKALALIFYVLARLTYKAPQERVKTPALKQEDFSMTHR